MRNNPSLSTSVALRETKDKFSVPLHFHNPKEFEFNSHFEVLVEQIEVHSKDGG